MSTEERDEEDAKHGRPFQAVSDPTKESGARGYENGILRSMASFALPHDNLLMEAAEALLARHPGVTMEKTGWLAPLLRFEGEEQALQAFREALGPAEADYVSREAW